MIQWCLGRSSFFFSHQRWHGSAGLHYEQLLQPSCTIPHLGLVSQKLIVPPQVKKIPCLFLCRESLLFFSYFFLLSLFVLSLGAFASLKACNLKVPRYGTYCIHILVWSLPTLILSLVPLLALANGTPASMMKAEAWWVNAFVSCFFLPSCSDTEVQAILWREIRWRNQHMERETNHLDRWVRPFRPFLFSPVTHARMVLEQKDLCSEFLILRTSSKWKWLSFEATKFWGVAPQ